ncbi:MAG: hypothetical protein EOO07_08110 [Chitinophagaceae bacterium]|nr:MAG: hypothetical protein EOO07_08110 [Chitinophagaceae bacterium]
MSGKTIAYICLGIMLIPVALYMTYLRIEAVKNGRYHGGKMKRYVAKILQQNRSTKNKSETTKDF